MLLVENQNPNPGPSKSKSQNQDTEEATTPLVERITNQESMSSGKNQDPRRGPSRVEDKIQDTAESIEGEKMYVDVSTPLGDNEKLNSNSRAGVFETQEKTIEGTNNQEEPGPSRL